MNIFKFHGTFPFLLIHLKIKKKARDSLNELKFTSRSKYMSQLWKSLSVEFCSKIFISYCRGSTAYPGFTVWSWASHLTFLNLSQPIWRIRWKLSLSEKQMLHLRWVFLYKQVIPKFNSKESCCVDGHDTSEIDT